MIDFLEKLKSCSQGYKRSPKVVKVQSCQLNLKICCDFEWARNLIIFLDDLMCINSAKVQNSLYLDLINQNAIFEAKKQIT